MALDVRDQFAATRRAFACLFAIGATATTVAACGADDARSTPAAPAAYVHLAGDPSRAMTICGQKTVMHADGSSHVETEQYDFDLIGRELPVNPAVAGRAGVRGITSCADARAYMSAYTDFIEADKPVVDEPSASAELVGETGEALKGGTRISVERGIVALNNGGCSGFIFSSRVIVTAAHCLPNRSGSGAWHVDYFDPDTGGKRTIASRSESLRYFQNPNWKGGTETPNGVGILVHPTGWPGTTTRDYLPVLWGSPRVVGTLTIFGSGWENFAGTDIGRLRVADFGVTDDIDNQYLITRSQGDRICKGDSGGAGTFQMAGGRTVVTLNSNGEFSGGSDLCVCKGCKSRHAVVTPLIVNWIRCLVSMGCSWTPDDKLKQSYVNCW